MYKILKCSVYVLSWLVLYLILALVWIGAEYVFEGAVHSSHVDGAVNGLLAYYMLREVRHGYL